MSNGRDAFNGSVDSDNAVSAANPPMPIGVTALSVPPANIISASPCCMLLYASPIELVPVAQAVTTFMLLPFNPSCIDTFPAAILVIIIGTRSGLILDGPFSRSFLWLFSIADNLPIPEPTETPAIYASSFSILSPESFKASNAAATAYWLNFSILLEALKSIQSAALNPFTSAARCALYPDESKEVIVSIPTVFFFIASQKSSVLSPIGVTAPSPVTTTLLIIYAYLRLQILPVLLYMKHLQMQEMQRNYLCLPHCPFFVMVYF